MALLGEKLEKQRNYTRSVIVFVSALGLLLVKIGLNKVPNFDSAIVRLTQAPDGESVGRDAYFVASWLGPAVFHVLGVDSEKSLFVLYCIVSISVVLITATTVATLCDSFRDGLARIVSMVFVPCIFLWVGYDSPLVLLLLVGYLLRRSLIAILVTGFLTGLQHAEIGVTASLAALIFSSFDYSKDRPKLREVWELWFLLAVLIGRTTLAAIFLVLETPVQSRGAIARQVFSSNVREWRIECSWASPTHCLPDTAVPLTWSILWPLVPFLIMFGYRSSREFARLTAVIVFAMIVAVPVLDQTRVALLSLTFVSFRLATEVRDVPGRHRMFRGNLSLVWVVIWLMLPIPWVWEGTVHWYGFFDGLRSGSAVDF